MWRGDPSNPAPNNKHEPINRSEKIIDDNRATHVRRDKDTQKNITLGLYDIDEIILNHLKTLQLQVEDAGKTISVPAFFGSPQMWVSVQKDGYIRDNQGKLILPAIILKRTSSEKDKSLMFFNRYLTDSVIKLYSPKNKYSQFSVLTDQTSPVSEVYSFTIPNHMVLTYHFIIWTEYIEQMNKLVEKIQFNTRDYWGNKEGFKFRTKVDSFGHTVELQSGDDRVVKTEFDLTVNAYILPDTMTKLDSHEETVKKIFTPKKIVFGAEVVSTGVDFAKNKNQEKWRNPNYPNLQKDVVIPTPDPSFDSSISSSNP